MGGFMKVCSYADSIRGRHNDVNEDSVLVMVKRVKKHTIVFTVLCDGVGGKPSGEFASWYVTKKLREWFEYRYLSYEGEMPLVKVQQQINSILVECNTFFLSSYKQCCTTCTVFISVNDKYSIIHIGDCRVYQVNKCCRQLTWDHTLCGGKNHILTRCLGSREQVKADIYTGMICKGSLYVICSDGYHEHQSIGSTFTNLMKNGFSFTINQLTRKEGNGLEPLDDSSIIALFYD